MRSCDDECDTLVNLEIREVRSEEEEDGSTFISSERNNFGMGLIEVSSEEKVEFDLEHSCSATS